MEALLAVLVFTPLVACRDEPVIRKPAQINEKKAPCDSSECHGRNEVGKMLDLCPNMAAYRTSAGEWSFVRETDSIFEFVADKFSGSGTGWPIFFVVEPNVDQAFNSHCILPDNNRVGMISLKTAYRGRNGELDYFGFDELWSGAVFECFNAENELHFRELFRRAASKTIGRDEFIRTAVSIEYSAVKKVKVFFQEVWEVWAETNNVEPNPASWFMNTPESLDEYLLTLRNAKNSYPEEPWGRYYDEYDAR